MSYNFVIGQPHEAIVEQEKQEKNKKNNFKTSIVLLLLLTSIILIIIFNLKRNDPNRNNIPVHNEVVTAGTTLRVGYIEQIVQFGNVNSKSDAQVIMTKNLDALEYYVTQAATNNVKLLLFPEFALTGLVNYMVPGGSVASIRAKMFYFLEKIPQPNLGVNSTACANVNFNDRPILQRLSCLAKNKNMYLSVNWGDYVTCSTTTDSNCPSDGHYQYNTQIVFNSNGEIIAKYYKIHLFNEDEYNTPTTQTPTYFNMPYDTIGNTIKIGLLTCFDSMYATPLWNLINTYNINFFLISHWWINTWTTSTAIQWFEALSRTYGINLVAAGSTWFYGAALPTWASGSGIFTQGKVLSSYFNYNNQIYSYLDYKDIPISIDGPYTTYTSVMPTNPTVTSRPRPFRYCSAALGYASPSTTLTNSVRCPTFNCTIELKINQYSTNVTPEYWYIYGIEGYYNTSDGNDVYYYEKICEAYKCASPSSCGLSYVTKTKFDSFKIRANFNGSVVPFIMASQQNANVYSKITNKTSYTLSNNGIFELQGTNLNGDMLLDIVVQGRMYSKDATFDG